MFSEDYFLSNEIKYNIIRQTQREVRFFEVEGLVRLKGRTLI